MVYRSQPASGARATDPAEIDVGVLSPSAGSTPLRHSLSGAHEARLVGQDDGLDPIAQGELGQDPADMSLDGALLDHQLTAAISVLDRPQCKMSRSTSISLAVSFAVELRPGPA